MGTHPIFESDFDCLTDSSNKTKREAKRGKCPTKRHRHIRGQRKKKKMILPAQRRTAMRRNQKNPSTILNCRHHLLIQLCRSPALSSKIRKSSSPTCAIPSPSPQIPPVRFQCFRPMPTPSSQKRLRTISSFQSAPWSSAAFLLEFSRRFSPARLGLYYSEENTFTRESSPSEPATLLQWPS